ncbi:glycosyltransferase family 2 protein [soil metagenome]
MNVERSDPVVSVLVAAKDEAASLVQLYHEVRTALDAPDPAGHCRDGWELILVDDGSTDDSWAIMRSLSARDGRVRALRLRRNFGKSAALAAGLAASRGDVIATLDGDLQDDPAEIPEMVRRLFDEEIDMVAGHKFQRRDPLGKRMPSYVFNAVTSKVTGLTLRDHNCGLKVAQREVYEALPIYGEMHRFFAAISHANGFVVVEHPVNHRPRLHGRSKFGLERYARGGLDLFTVVTLTRYRRRPAHLFGGLGLLSGVMGLAVLLWLTGVWFFTDEPIGNRPLLLFGVLLVILAVQLVSLGVLAELIVTRDARHDDPDRYVRSRVP